MPSLRSATLDDAEAVATLMTGLNGAVGPEGFASATAANIIVTADQARARMTAMMATEQVLLAEEGGEAIGLLSLRIAPYLSEDVPYAEVAELYVAAAHRRGRVGMLLMAQAEFLARERGCTSIHVSTGRNNPAGQAFYAALAYQPEEVGFEKPLPPKRSARQRRAEG